jgi:hypothetical protein
MENFDSSFDASRMFVADISYRIEPLDEPNPAGIFGSLIERG